VNEPHRIVAGSRPWLRSVFDDDIAPLPGKWTFVSEPRELDKVVASTSSLTQIYFLHWSWKVSASLLESCECINFHMTDLPYGRGGSPLQNLISRGCDSTMLSALRMTEELDAGPVYLKRALPLHGSAEAIYLRAARLSALMIAELVASNGEPEEQRGAPTLFSRRSPGDSELLEGHDLVSAYDFVRMLDADGYPRAFIDLGGLRIELSRAVIYSDKVVADAIIRSKEKTE